jgi:hypothetical protein
VTVAGTLVVRDLVTAARDEHPTFDDRRHPDPVLLRALSRYNKELLGKIIRLDDSKGVEYFDQALPLAVFDNGIAIPAYKYPFGLQATALGRTRPHPLDLVSWEESSQYRHAGYLLNGILFLCGRPHDWTSFSSVRFLYVAEPAALAMDLATVLTAMPDSAEPTLVAYLALKMAQRGGAGEGETRPDPGVFGAQWQAAEDRLLDEMGRNTQAVSSVIRDVM